MESTSQEAKSPPPSSPLDGALPNPPEAVQLESLPPPSEPLPEAQPHSGTFEVKIHKSPSDRYSDYSSPDTSRDFPQLEDSCVDRMLAVAKEPELKIADPYIEPESPPVECSWQPVHKHEVPLSARYRVHDRYSCRICQTKGSIGTSSLRSSGSQMESLEYLKKCADCFNRYPWYFEICPHCEVKASLGRAPDSRYKQKVMQWCTT